jgi:transposase
MRVGPRVELTPEPRATLQEWANGRKTPVRLAERSRIVLMAAEGKRDIDIAAAISITLGTAARWRKRFLRHGPAGLEKDDPRPGRTPAISKEAVPEIIRCATLARARPQATPCGVLKTQQRSQFQRQTGRDCRTLTCSIRPSDRSMRG